MPPLGMALGNVDFTDLMYVLKESADPAKVVAIRCGAFLQTIIDFLIIAFSVYVVLKTYARLQRRKPVVTDLPPVPTSEEKLLVEISDILKENPAPRV